MSLLEGDPARLLYCKAALALCLRPSLLHMQPTDPDKFSAKAWDAIVEAQDVARRFRQQYLEVEHVTLAMLEQAGEADVVLRQAGLSPEQILQGFQ